MQPYNRPIFLMWINFPFSQLMCENGIADVTLIYLKISTCEKKYICVENSLYLNVSFIIIKWSSTNLFIHEYFAASVTEVYGGSTKQLLDAQTVYCHPNLTATGGPGSRSDTMCALRGGGFT